MHFLNVLVTEQYSLQLITVTANKINSYRKIDNHGQGDLMKGRRLVTEGRIQRLII